MDKNFTALQAATHAINELDTARASGQFMVAIWHLVDGKPVLARTCWDFPVGQFTPCVDLLVSNLAKEMEALQNPPAQPPLPAAVLPTSDVVDGSGV